MQPYDIISYKGCKILIHIDEDCQNPLTDCDGMPPVYCYSDSGNRHGSLLEYNDPPSIRDLVLALPSELFERGKRVETLKLAIGFSTYSSAVCMRDILFSCYDTSPDSLQNWLADYLSEEHSFSFWSSAVESFELIESLCELLGWACYSTQINGYSQGDCWQVLAIATPNFLSVTGVKPENAARDLERCVETFGSWLRGDCYGYTLEDSEGEELEDACWGFIGSDHETSGLFSYAKPAIDSHLEALAQTEENLEAAFSF